MKAHISDLGVAALAGSPADFEKFIADETKKWAKVVKFSGAKPLIWPDIIASIQTQAIEMVAYRLSVPP